MSGTGRFCGNEALIGRGQTRKRPAAVGADRARDNLKEVNSMLSQVSVHVQKTMSSREIAELTGKEHKHVRRDIEVMFHELNIDIDGYVHFWTHPQNKQTYEEFRLDRDLTDCLLTGYSAKARMAVIKRWRELENGAPVSAPAFEVPTTLSGALRLAADQAEQIEQQQQQIEAAKPAVEFLGRYVETGNTKSIRETAKILGLPERAFIKAMLDDKIIYRQSGNILPHQKHHVADRFEVKTGERNGHAYTQTRVTSAGIDYLARVYGHWIGEVA